MKYLILLPFFLIFISAAGQESLVQSLYLNAGIGSAMKKGSNFHFGGNISTKNLYTLSFNYYHIGFKDDNLSYPKGLFGPPIHSIDDFELSAIKFYKMDRTTRGGFGLGISYLRYYEPTNIKYSTGTLIDNYTYDEVKHLSYGIKLKTILEIHALQFLGFSIELFYQYNQFYPYGGVNINVLVGKLRQKN